MKLESVLQLVNSINAIQGFRSLLADWLIYFILKCGPVDYDCIAFGFKALFKLNFKQIWKNGRLKKTTNREPDWGLVRSQISKNPISARMIKNKYM